MLRSVSTGAWVPLPCQRNRCRTCGPRKAVATAIAAGLRKPDQMVTLTQVGDSARVIRGRLAEWRSRLKAEGYGGEHWGGIERNPRGTGHHVHLYRLGGFVPQGLVSDVAKRCGMGRVVWVEKWRGTPRDVVYGVKTARGGASYSVKGSLDGEGLAGFLELHGGRYGVWSRGFFGKPYREAVREALTLPDREGHDPGPWVVKGIADLYGERMRAARAESA